MTVQFTGEPTWTLRVTMYNPSPFTEVLGGEVLELTRPAYQSDQDFLAAVAKFHGLVMAQDLQFFAIGGHCIKPYFVERVELMITYVDLEDRQ